MPLSGGILAKKVLKASSPPADAPMPTINEEGDVLPTDCLVRPFASRAFFS
jgi:hypothetical protein